MSNSYESLRDRLLSANKNGISYNSISCAVGISRTAISQFANHGLRLRDEQLEIIDRYLNERDAEDASTVEATGTEAAPALACLPQTIAYRTEIGLYQTEEYRDTIGWLEYLHENRNMGVMIGYPGSGKTTIVGEFAKNRPSVRLIDCWPSMRLGDLLAEIASAIGIAISGNNYNKARQITKELAGRTDVMLVFDECENLRSSGGDVQKFDVIRKIWDTTKTPIVFCGTPELENILTRGGGRANLAQLYRRKYEIKLTGIKADEVRAILSDYNIELNAVEVLVRLAVDVKHGGMGNFVEVLHMALNAANGGQISEGDVKSAKQFKLLY